MFKIFLILLGGAGVWVLWQNHIGNHVTARTAGLAVIAIILSLVGLWGTWK